MLLTPLRPSTSGAWIEERIWRYRVSAHATTLMAEVIRICPEMTNAFYKASCRCADGRDNPDADMPPVGDIPEAMRPARVAEDPRPP